MKVKQITFEDFWENYKPKINPLHENEDDEDSENYKINWGTLEENDLIKDYIGSSKIWTVIEGERDSLYLVSGYKRLNRLYHYITEVPYTEEIEIELIKGYPEINNDDLSNLESIKNYMRSRDEPKYIDTLDKVIEYVKRTNG